MAQQEYLSGVLGLGPGHEPLIITPCWNLNEFMGHLVCVIDPDSSWIPRIILAPDYIWLGLHWDGSNCRDPLAVYFQCLLEILRQHPLHFSQHWMELLHQLDAYLCPQPQGWVEPEPMVKAPEPMVKEPLPELMDLSPLSPIAPIIFGDKYINDTDTCMWDLDVSDDEDKDINDRPLKKQRCR